jgi:hypothetical protein
LTWPAGVARAWSTPSATSIPPPTLEHLSQMLGPFGLFEHARNDKPRPENGYCTDDAGRALALACRLPGDPQAERLAEATLSFLERAHSGSGCFRLRLGPDGCWTGEPPSEDGGGRALLGLGVAASSAPWPRLRRRAETLFVRAADFRPRAPRAAAYAVLGATEALGAPAPSRQLEKAARGLIEALAPVPLGQTGAGGTDRHWPWPEGRLTYANALLPHASMKAAAALEDERAVARSLELLWWLVREEHLDGHFSFTPVGGRGPGGKKPAFDQQPIEAAAMAHACAHALDLSGDGRWVEPFWAAVGWFLGHNDAGARMWDPATGGGFDGLQPDGVNRNQGAESTIAFVATMELAQRLARRQPAAASADKSSETDAVAAPTYRSAAP